MRLLLFFNPWNIFLRLILLNPFYKIRNLRLRIGKEAQVAEPGFKTRFWGST